MVPFKPNIVIGCMVFLGMKHHVHAIGLAGMERLPNNYALAVCFIMKMPTAVTGHLQWPVAKSIVSV